jgi:hypothetical protein
MQIQGHYQNLGYIMLDLGFTNDYEDQYLLEYNAMLSSITPYHTLRMAPQFGYDLHNLIIVLNNLCSRVYLNPGN